MTTIRRPLAASAALALSAGLLSALPSQAATTSGDARGRTTANLTLRTVPTSQGKAVGTYYKGTRITITCKVRGQRVAGNDIWYLVPDESGTAFVAARYVKNIGALPHWCHGGGTTALTARGRVAVRQAPTDGSPAVRTLRKGARATAVCRIATRDRHANGWYHLNDGRWVPVDAVLANHATAPCH